MVSVFEIVHIRTVRGTQTHHQVFALPLEVHDFLLVVRDTRAADICADVAGEPRTDGHSGRNGRRSQSEIVGKIPVFEIMPGTKTRFCEI